MNITMKLSCTAYSSSILISSVPVTFDHSETTVIKYKKHCNIITCTVRLSGLEITLAKFFQGQVKAACLKLKGIRQYSISLYYQQIQQLELIYHVMNYFLYSNIANYLPTFKSVISQNAQSILFNFSNMCSYVLVLMSYFVWAQQNLLCDM